MRREHLAAQAADKNTTQALSALIGTACIVCRAGMHLYASVRRPSICLSQSGPQQQSLLPWPGRQKTLIGGRAFPVAAAKLWNGLPSDVVSLVTVGVKEQAEDMLVLPLLRNCLTLHDISFS